MKKLFLLLMLISVAITQNSVFANEQYQEDFVINAIKNKVEMNWVRASLAPSISAVISFNVNTDGSVSPVSVMRSSGNPNFDESIIKAVYKSVPFEYSSVINKPISMEIFFSPSFLVANEIKHTPGGGNIVNVSNKNGTIDFSGYLWNLQSNINTNWTPKAYAKVRNNIAVITIDKDGALSNPSILEPSHDIRFDNSTLDAIAKSVPMDAFPSNITAPTTNVQLCFHYQTTKEHRKKVTNHYVTASVLNVEGFDKYTDMVEKVLKNNLQDKSTIFERRLVFEAQINSVGKLKYVKIVEPSADKFFNKSVYEILENSSFPQFPPTINQNSITLKYELITGLLTGTRIFPRPE
jgi:TonB family protein